MAGKVIRSVATKFTADISDFEAKLNKWSKGVEKSAKKVQALGSALTKSITIPATAAIVGIGALVNKTADYADAIQNMSVRTGMSYKTLQELRFVTDQTGVSFDAVGTSLVAFTKTLDDSMKKGSDVSMMYDMLGINVKGAGDKLKPVNVLYDEAIKKLQGISDETAQSMIASKLFGKQYAEILPLLKMTAEEYENMKKQANDMRLVKSDDFINKMAAFQDRLGAFKLKFGSIGMGLAEKFMPIMEKLAEMAETTLIPALVKVIDFVGRMMDKFDKMSPKMQDFLLMASGSAIMFGPLLTGFGDLIGLISKIPGLAGIAKAAMAGIFSTGGLVAAGAAATVGVAVEGYKNFKSYTAEQQKKAETWKSQANSRPLNDVEKLMGGAMNFSKEAQAQQWKDFQANPPAAMKAKIEQSKVEDAAAKAQKDSDKALTDFDKKWDAYIKSLETGSDKAASKVDTLKDSIRSMVDALREQTKNFANFVGLFDTFERKSISGTRLLNRLKAQVKAMGEWRNSLASLEKRGVSQQFINDLRSQGAGAVDSVNALAKMSDAQLKQYTSLYGQKNSIAGGEASKLSAGEKKINTNIEKQINITVTGSKGDADAIANTIVKKLRLAGYTI